LGEQPSTSKQSRGEKGETFLGGRADEGGVWRATQGGGRKAGGFPFRITHPALACTAKWG